MLTQKNIDLLTTVAQKLAEEARYQLDNERNEDAQWESCLKEANEALDLLSRVKQFRKVVVKNMPTGIDLLYEIAIKVGDQNGSLTVSQIEFLQSYKNFYFNKLIYGIDWEKEDE